MADFQQAVKWMKEGKKVRRAASSVSDYRFMDEGRIKYNLNGVVTPGITGNAVEATDWEIYEEEEDWELGEQMCTLNNKVGFSLFDTHKFIQKVKEDLSKCDDTNLTGHIKLHKILTIIDKRAGNLK